MLGLIFNDDGSIFAAALPKYVTQGSSGNLDSLKICIAFKDKDITDEGTTVICRFRRPDGIKNDITSFNNGTFEFQGIKYKCKYGYLTADQTLYEGILLVSIEVLTDVGSNILYTYNARITVNPTTYDPTSDYVLINNAQYENLATQIENLQYRGASKQYVDEIVTHAVFEDVSVVFDDFPIINSNNAVKSKGIYAWVDLKIGLAIARAKQEAIDAAHPIGSIYMSLDPTDPHDLFGGTWERIKHVFLLGAGDSTDTVGTTGGERDHALTIPEMPAHQHAAELDYINTSGGSPVLEKVDLAADTTPGTGGTWKGVATGAGYNNLVTNVGQTGGGQPHNNMPPYLAVYVWKRVS